MDSGGRTLYEVLGMLGSSSEGLDSGKAPVTMTRTQASPLSHKEGLLPTLLSVGTVIRSVRSLEN